MGQGAVTLGADMAQAFEKAQVKVVWAWAMHCGFPQRILRVLCGYFGHPRGVLFEECVADCRPSQPSFLAQMVLFALGGRDAGCNE